MRNTWIIIILSTLIPFIILIGMIAFIVTALMSASRFYPLLTALLTVLVITLILIGAMSRIKKKTYAILVCSCLLAIGAVVGGYKAVTAYQSSLKVDSVQDVRLTDYEPFRVNSKSVKLDEPAAISLIESLPKLDGATALYPLYAAFAQAVYPSKEYDSQDSEVISSGTSKAFDQLIRGKVDIIFTAEPSEEQLMEAANRGVELQITPIGREAFVFFVQTKQQVTSVTTTDIQQVYSGKITNWKELGGKDAPIKAFQRPDNSGSQTMLLKLMKDQPLIDPPKEDVAYGMGEIIRQTADYRNHPNAIGFSFLFFATEMVKNKDVRLLEINGIKPERASIQDGTYPLSANFYAITAGTDNPNAARLIEWILDKQGQRLVELTGYTPVK